MRQQLIDLLLLPEHPEQEIERACHSIQDWPAFFDLARHEGLLGVVSDRVIRHVPADRRRVAAQTLALQNLAAARHLAALKEVLATLEARGIAAVTLKGVLLAERVYPHPTSRFSSDIDLLLLPEDLDAATSALEASGYQVRPDFEELASPSRHHLCLVRPRSLTVELHFRVTAVLGSEIESAAFFRRSRPYTSVAGINTRILEPEDEFLQLAVRTVADRFALLRLYDLKLFLRRYRGLRWEVISRRARETGFNTPVFLTAWAMDACMGEPEPAAHLDLSPNFLAGRRPERVVAGLSASRSPSASPARHLRYLACKGIACDRPWSGAWTYLRGWMGFPSRYLRFRRAHRAAGPART